MFGQLFVVVWFEKVLTPENPHDTAKRTSAGSCEIRMLKRYG